MNPGLLVAICAHNALNTSAHNDEPRKEFRKAMNKDILLNKINSEMQKCQDLYNNVESFLLVIMAACYRAKIEYIIDEKYKVSRFALTESVRKAFLDTEDDAESLQIVYSLLVNSLGDNYIKELAERPVEPMTVEQVIDTIGTQLDYYDKINVDTLIRLQTLQWVKDEIEKETV